MIGTLLNKTGTVRIGEFADALGYYAVVSAEHDSREGIYLGGWAAMLRELADERTHPADIDGDRKRPCNVQAL